MVKFECNLEKNMHEWVFQRLSKLHECEGRVYVFQIAQETILLLINNIHEKNYAITSVSHI
jgi:hypothetical protein